MKRFMSILMITILLFSFSMIVPELFGSSQASAESYNVPVDVDKHLEIKSKMGTFKKSEQSWGGNIEAELIAHGKTNKEITLTYELDQLSKDQMTIDRLKSSVLFRGKLKPEQSKKVTVHLNQLEPGQYRVRFQAKSKQNKDITWGGLKDVLFEITDKGIQQEWSKDLAAEAPAVNQNGNTSVIISPRSSKYGQMSPIKPRENHIQQSKSQANSTASTVTLTGKWQFPSRSGEVLPVKRARVVVSYRNSSNQWVQAATTYTDDNGNSTATYSSPTDSNLWQVSIYSNSTSISVVNKDNSIYSSYLQHQNLASGGDIGTWTIPNTDIKKAFWVYEDTEKIRSLMTPLKNPGSIHIYWYPSSTDGSYYMPGESVHLDDAAANTPSIPMHEVGHNYMYNVYGYFPNAPKCSPHYIERASSKGCAWTEGWANFVAFVGNNDPTFYFPNGATVNVENTNSFDSGDRVEGRIAGSLWDLYDSNQDTDSSGTYKDDKQYSFAMIYQAMWSNPNDTFSEYWNRWKALGYQVDANSCLFVNSIFYN